MHVTTIPTRTSTLAFSRAPRYRKIYRKAAHAQVLTTASVPLLGGRSSRDHPASPILLRRHIKICIALNFAVPRTRDGDGTASAASLLVHPAHNGIVPLPTGQIHATQPTFQAPFPNVGKVGRVVGDSTPPDWARAELGPPPQLPPSP